MQYIVPKKNEFKWFCERHSSRIFDANVFFPSVRREYPSVRQYNLIQKCKKNTTTAAAATTVDEFLVVIHFSHGLSSFFSGPKVKTSKIDHHVVAVRHSASSHIYNWLYLKSVKWHTIKLDSQWKWLAIYFIHRTEMKWNEVWKK